MVKDITYQNLRRQEENTPLVTIYETNVATKQSTAIDSRKSAYVIDLTKASFGGITYPEPGSQWYVKKISGVWALMARAPQQNPQLDPGLSPQPGQTYLGNGGTTVIVGDVEIKGSLVVDQEISPPGIMIGGMILWPTNVAPTNWSLCDGTSLLRATYPTLSALLLPAIGTATMTIASPCVVSFTAHGLSIGDKVFFTTTGALPTGVSTDTTYWVIAAGFGANSFEIATTQNGSAINTTGSQSGVHTLLRTYHGVADATHFNVPDFRGKNPTGRDSSQTEFAAIGMTGGSKTHTMTSAEMFAHTHAVGTLVNAADAAHTHGVNITTGTVSSDHTHTIDADKDTASGSFGYSVHRGAGSGAFQSNASTGISANHTHAVNGTSDAGSSHNHTISGSTASTGSTTAFSTLDPYTPINYIIRLL